MFPSFKNTFYHSLYKDAKNAVQFSSSLFSSVSVRLFVTPWTAAHHPPPSMGFSRQEYWSGLPLPSPGDLPDPGIKPRPPALQLPADALPSEPPGKPHGMIRRIKSSRIAHAN